MLAPGIISWYRIYILQEHEEYLHLVKYELSMYISTIETLNFELVEVEQRT